MTVPADRNAEWRSAIPIDSLHGAGTPAVLLKAGVAAAEVGYGDLETPDEPTGPTGDFRSPGSSDRTTAYQPSVEADEPNAVSDPDAPSTGAPSRTAVVAGERRRTRVRMENRSVPSHDPVIPKSLSGYEVVKELGRGGMGAVFLARQVSLDRPVVLKVMSWQSARDPAFVAELTREAFAAAQIVHHNLVQTYDIGAEAGVNYFSTEFVDGRSLGDLVKKPENQRTENAIGYVLQAARGLKYAHDRGMVHLDVKPDNLMLNAHGVVKVADLGLAHAALCSPSYTPPEQFQDAATVDHRADIYSLGAILYALLAGRPPMDGEDVAEVMAKHATEPPSPIASATTEVNAVVLKALSKDPGDRQQTMGEFIADLERILPAHAGAGWGTVESLDALERCARRFQSAPTASLRKTLVLAFFLGSLVAATIGLLAGGGTLAAAIVALATQTAVAHSVFDGLTRKSYFFARVREWAFGARRIDWVLAGVGLVAILVLLWAGGLLWVSVGTAVLAAGVAFAFHAFVENKLDVERQPALDECEKLLKRLRLGGMDEDALRLFVAKNTGQGWEEFYEALFGFESKLAIRPAMRARAGDERLPRFASWRELVVALLDRVEQARREDRTRRLLQRIETEKLRAEGFERNAAENKAEAAADEMIETAAEVRLAGEKAVNVQAVVWAAEKPAERLAKAPANGLRQVIGAVVGWRVRFLAGAALVVIGALWVRTQITLGEVENSVSTVSAAETTEAGVSFPGILDRGHAIRPLVVGSLLGWCDSLNPLVAGLILVLSTLTTRPLGIVLQVVGAVIALVGHRLGAAPVGPVEPHQLSMLVGVILAAVAVFVSRQN